MKNITGRDDITQEHLQSLETEIKAFVEYESIAQKVKGFISFVNIMWFAAILSIVISFPPCVYSLFGPQLDKLWKIIKEYGLIILKDILLPVVTFLHNWGVFEFLFYFLMN